MRGGIWYKCFITGHQIIRMWGGIWYKCYINVHQIIQNVRRDLNTNVTLLVTKSSKNVRRDLNTNVTSQFTKSSECEAGSDTNVTLLSPNHPRMWGGIWIQMLHHRSPNHQNLRRDLNTNVSSQFTKSSECEAGSEYKCFITVHQIIRMWGGIYSKYKCFITVHQIIQNVRRDLNTNVSLQFTKSFKMWGGIWIQMFHYSSLNHSECEVVTNVQLRQKTRI